MNTDEMWTRLEAHQPFADRRGYGQQWASMCFDRDAASCAVARDWAAELARGTPQSGGWEKYSTASGACAEAYDHMVYAHCGHPSWGEHMARRAVQCIERSEALG